MWSRLPSPLQTFGFQQYHQSSWRSPGQPPHNYSSAQPYAPSQSASILGPGPSQPGSALGPHPSQAYSSFLPGSQMTRPAASSPALSPWLSNAAVPPSDLPLLDSNWYMDTGATLHLASDSGILRFIFNSRTSTPEHVLVGNGSAVPITAKGHSFIPNTSFSLHNTLIAPSIIKNLISVCQFTKDNSVSVEFDPLGFSVKDLRTRSVIYRCNSTGGLYPFSTSDSSPHALSASAASPAVSPSASPVSFPHIERFFIVHIIIRL